MQGVHIGIYMVAYTLVKYNVVRSIHQFLCKVAYNKEKSYAVNSESRALGLERIPARRG